MQESKVGHETEAGLRLTGDWNIQQASELKTMLLKALNENGELMLDFHDVTRVDLTFFQLICAAHRWSAARGKHLSHAGPFPNAIAEHLESAGFMRVQACRSVNEKKCFWAGGGR